MKTLENILLCGYISPMKNTARMFKALADETRLRIIVLLLHEGELCVCDIMAALDLPQSTTSRHLAYLKNSGWVDDRREGIWMYYSLAEQNGTVRAEIGRLLKAHLGAVPAVETDRERLAGFGRNNSCA